MSIGKSKRFEIFKRDEFTCQYCGNRPPDVVLEVDHIHPVSKGGTSEAPNLTTSCFDCNRGKRDKVLSEVVPHPDADLLYLETQQEIAEMQRYQLSLEERDKALSSLVGSLQETWVRASGLDWHPADHVIRQLLVKYSPEVAGTTLVDVAVKVGTGYLSGKGDGWVRYLWGVARNITDGPAEVSDESTSHQNDMSDDAWERGE